MYRHSINKLGACICILLCSISLAASGQQNRFIREKADGLAGKYTVSFRTEERSFRYLLSIDSVQGMYFYGTLCADTTVYKKLHDFVYVKGILAGSDGYDFMMKPVFRRGTFYDLPCAPSDWLFNNKVCFTKIDDRLVGRMVVTNDGKPYAFSFYGLKRPAAVPLPYLVAVRK